MVDIGESTSPAFPKDEIHKEVEVKIISITDAKGKSIKDGASDYDPRKNAVDGDKFTEIKYKIKNNDALVMVSIIPSSGNEIGCKYYKDHVDYLFGEGGIGEQTIKWDGRVFADHQRLIILGEYEIQVDALCMACGKTSQDKATIKVRKPYAHAFGAMYPSSQYSVSARELRPPANHLRKKLKELSDGSGFESLGSATDSAITALKNMKEESAVWYCSGHAAPGIIDFYDAAFNNTSLNSKNSVGKAFGMADADLAEIDGLADDALDDVFLAVIHGCETAKKPGSAKSLPDALTAKGVDLAIGFRPKVLIMSMLKWAKFFYSALNKRKGVRKAAKIAKSRLSTMERLKSGFTISKSGSASYNEKLLPARYGRKV